MWFKGLVSAACIAVIAGVGYYFWSEHERRSLANEAAAQQRQLADVEQACEVARVIFIQLMHSRTDPRFRGAEAKAEECAALGLIPKEYWRE